MPFWSRKDKPAKPISETNLNEYAKMRGLNPSDVSTVKAYMQDLGRVYGISDATPAPDSEEEPEVDEDAEDEAFKDDLDRLLEKKAPLSSKKSEPEDGEEPKPYLDSWPRRNKA